MLFLKRLLWIVLGVVLMAITVGYYRFELERIAQIREAIVKSEAILAEKREAVREYKEKVAFYKTEEGIAHLAREQYNLVGEGEKVLLLKSSDADAEPEISPAEPAEQE